MCVINGEPRPDRKKRGGFLFGEHEWVYHCFNCDFKTGWKLGSSLSFKAKRLLEQLGFDKSELQRISLDLLREEETAQLLNPLLVEKKLFKPNWPEVDLPKGSQFVSEIDPTKIHRNLENGLLMLSDRNLLHWDDWVYTDKELKFYNRIILPYRYNGKIVGYTARYIGSPPKDVPKYLVSKPKDFVFNLDHQTYEREFVIVVEGDFDAISIDAISIGGNTLSENQASLISQLHKKTILLPDADKPGNNLIEPAIKHGWYVSFPDWLAYFKDANAASQELGRAFVVRSTLDSATDNPTKIRLLARRYLR